MPLAVKTNNAHFFISAGEASGDVIGADLLSHLKQKFPKLTPTGIAGPNMRSIGMHALASTEDLAVMGIAQVAAKLASIKTLEARILGFLDTYRPEFAVLIDYPGFHFHLAEQLTLRGIPVFQYVAPKLWAWGEHRLPRLKRDFAAVLGILPFEKEYFLSNDIPYIYVGTPQIDRIRKIRVNKSFLLPYIPQAEEKKVIALLPGSRTDEVKRALPIFKNIKDSMLERKGLAGMDLSFIMPLAPSLLSEKEHLFPDAVSCSASSLPSSTSPFMWEGIYVFTGMSLELLSLADLALITSGTATLECALLETPQIVVYKMDTLSYEIAKKKVKLPYVSLANLVAQKKIVPEYIQEFDEKDVTSEACALLLSETRKNEQQAAYRNLKQQLKGQAGLNAAQYISHYFSQ